MDITSHELIPSHVDKNNKKFEYCLRIYFSNSTSFRYMYVIIRMSYILSTWLIRVIVASATTFYVETAVVSCHACNHPVVEVCIDFCAQEAWKARERC